MKFFPRKDEKRRWEKRRSMILRVLNLLELGHDQVERSHALGYEFSFEALKIMVNLLRGAVDEKLKAD